jgi:hypothetical protein
MTRLLDRVSRWLVGLVVGRQVRSLSPELLAKMESAMRDFDVEGFRRASDELIEDSVRVAHEAMLASADWRGRRRIGSLTADGLGAALYAAVAPSLVDAPHAVRMAFSEACSRYAGRAAR